ncbi:MAG: 4Fe-4S binding protein [Candidatus Omnitrophica bacterium]|nr:4Fe-4S binding protein [Candidatus Omnitrophota bacterium]MCM8807208.1 4Fe-4S binding protein [Candidatus Omnitrophota bacterium]
MKYIIKIDKERCKSCKLCLEVCPNGIFKVSDKFNKIGYHYVEVVNGKNCTGCKRCVIICPDVAIEIYKEK